MSDLIMCISDKWADLGKIKQVDMHIFALTGRNPFAMRPSEKTAATGYVKSNKAAEVTDAIGNVENATKGAKYP